MNLLASSLLFTSSHPHSSCAPGGGTPFMLRRCLVYCDGPSRGAVKWLCRIHNDIVFVLLEAIGSNLKPSGGSVCGDSPVQDYQHKNWFIECENCKCHIKSISKGNILIFGTNKVMILSFVVRNSHRFSFVFWATIGLARKILPNVNQFFESLYPCLTLHRILIDSEGGGCNSS